jgi:hypothetical protein
MDPIVFVIFVKRFTYSRHESFDELNLDTIAAEMIWSILSIRLWLGDESVIPTSIDLGKHQNNVIFSCHRHPFESHVLVSIHKTTMQDHLEMASFVSIDAGVRIIGKSPFRELVVAPSLLLL